MSVKAEVTRTYDVEAMCDNCGTVKTWTQATDPDAEVLTIGFEVPFGYERVTWFCQRACVHEYVDRTFIDHLRIAEGASA